MVRTTHRVSKGAVARCRKLKMGGIPRLNKAPFFAAALTCFLMDASGSERDAAMVAMKSIAMRSWVTQPLTPPPPDKLVDPI